MAGLSHEHAVSVDYQALRFDYHPAPVAEGQQPLRHPVVVAGAGPVGLSLAIDLAQRGIRVLLLDNDNRLSAGSRAICFAKRTLEIWDRLGVGQRMCDKGVSWNVGKVYFRDQPVYRFDLLPEPAHERPAFINLQQYYAEGYLVERAMELPLIEIRWQHGVCGLTPHDDHVLLKVDTPDGGYELRADYLAACDGSRSTVRSLMGLESQGRVFRDRFLIADVKMAADFPAERWFWFDPLFNPKQSALLHTQPDNVWRIDFQIGWEADPEHEKKPQNIMPRIKAFLAHVAGAEVDFTLEWASVYTFACLRMQHFRHGRVFFAGDSAHGVSPFGARGANSGVQDGDNLAWKLAAVLQGRAGDSLLDTYGPEREFAADENIRNSTRATDFITPKSEVSRLFRDAVLELAREHAFARRIVNSGRLSVPATLRDSALNSADVDVFEGSMRPGAAAADALLMRNGKADWLLREIGPDFTLLVFGPPPAWAAALPLRLVNIDASELIDSEGWAARRYDARPGTAYLFRPDQHVCARWRSATEAQVRQALACAHAAA